MRARMGGLLLSLSVAPAAFALAVASQACSSGSSSNDAAGAAQTSAGEMDRLQLTDDELANVVTTKATCPFIAASLAMKNLFVYGSADKPLAQLYVKNTEKTSESGSVEGAEKATANDGLFKVGESSAKKKHGLNSAGYFSLAFPGSAGAHKVHSGILMGDPSSPDSGRLNIANLDRLIKPKAEGGHAVPLIDKNGNAMTDASGKPALGFTLEELGRFVASNAACAQEDLPGQLQGIIQSLEGLDLSGAINAVTSDSSNAVTSVVQAALMFTVLSDSVNAPQDADTPMIAQVDVERFYAGDPVVTADGQRTYNPLTRSLPARTDGPQKGLLLLGKNALQIAKSALASTLEYAGTNDCPQDQGK